MFVSGQNEDRDLCMYLVGQLEGLQPGVKYSVIVAVDLASNHQGESVWLRAGAASERPHWTVDEEGWYRVVPDMGAMSWEGEHGVPMGTIAKPEDGTEDYVALSRTSHGLILTARADEDGRIWVLFGTDSTFEGPTSIYYTSVTIFLDPQA